MTVDKKKFENPAVIAGVRIIVILAILVFGFIGNKALVSMKKEPKESQRSDAIARVEGIIADRQNFQTYLSGFGTAESHQVTEIAPQVTGRVLEVHPDLEVGRVISKGDVLFKIDPTDYDLALQRSEANLASAKATIEQIRIQNKSNTRQLSVTERMAELAENNFERFSELVSQNQAESVSAKENAELALVREREKLIMMENQVEQFESDLAVAEANVKVAESQLNSAREDLDRTVVKAPFDARIVSKNIEPGKLVSINQMAVTIADDSILEIPVSIDGGEVANWLKVERAELQPQWFDNFSDYPVSIKWTSDPTGFEFKGMLDRVSMFDTRNRTFNLVAQVRNDRQTAEELSSFPLANGMFCEVEIPGKIAENVIPIPRDAIDSQGIVMISENNELRSRDVEVIRIQDDTVLIGQGLNDGDIVLTRRPPNPIEGMKLDVNIKGDGVENAGGESLAVTEELIETQEAGS